MNKLFCVACYQIIILFLLVQEGGAQSTLSDISVRGEPNPGEFSMKKKDHTGRQLTETAIINNGVIMLGINNDGTLNVPGPPDALKGEPHVGLRFFRDNGWYESTAYGCKCEGFGASAVQVSNGNEFWGGSDEHFSH